jgi:hypothetical protein
MLLLKFWREHEYCPILGYVACGLGVFGILAAIVSALMARSSLILAKGVTIVTPDNDIEAIALQTANFIRSMAPRPGEWLVIKLIKEKAP